MFNKLFHLLAAASMIFTPFLAVAESARANTAATGRGNIGTPIEGSVHGWGGNGGHWGSQKGQYAQGSWNQSKRYPYQWTNRNGWNHRGWPDRYNYGSYGSYGSYGLNNNLGYGTSYYYSSPYYSTYDSYPYYSAYPTTYYSYPSTFSNFVYPSYPYQGTYYYNNYQSSRKPYNRNSGGVFIYNR